jgi:hypothetical protein
MLNFGWLFSSIAEKDSIMHRQMFPFCDNIVSLYILQMVSGLCETILYRVDFTVAACFCAA